MITLEKTYTVERGIEDVFHFLSNPESDPLWQNAVKEARLTTNRPVGPGTTYEIVFSFLGRKMSFTAETCAFEPPRGFAYRSTSGPFSYAGRYQFEALPEGTRVDFTVEIETQGFFGIVPESLLSKTFSKQFDGDIATLKRLLEEPVSNEVEA